MAGSGLGDALANDGIKLAVFFRSEGVSFRRCSFLCMGERLDYATTILECQMSMTFIRMTFYTGDCHLTVAAEKM